ncbi:MAG: hypothetical protein JO307_34095 [Bryobacterales bacterium]|nr:hypothetical protein [Bryobacterales bacterium]MBV9399619.1 hypothetical protein [Bryobacterales bacterium]
MSCFRPFSLLLVLVLLASAPSWAETIVNFSVNLTQLTIKSPSGWLVVLPPVATSVFAQARDGIGCVDQESGSASATTLFANEGVTAQPVTGNVAANVNVPNQFQPLRQRRRGNLCCSECSK